MIGFNYEIDYRLDIESSVNNWLSDVIRDEGCNEGEINFIFCDDEYLHHLNLEFLNHDTLTDIITFDYSVGKELHGDVYISIERVRDNASDFKVTFEQELGRVMVHGILHLCGYKDKTDKEKLQMRSKENHYLERINVDS